jgi:hypothetical protein
LAERVHSKTARNAKVSSFAHCTLSSTSSRVSQIPSSSWRLLAIARGGQPTESGLMGRPRSACRGGRCIFVSGEGGGRRQGIDGQVCQQPVEEGLAWKPKDRTVRSIEAVDEAVKATAESAPSGSLAGPQRARSAVRRFPRHRPASRTTLESRISGMRADAAVRVAFDGGSTSWSCS